MIEARLTLRALDKTSLRGEERVRIAGGAEYHLAAAVAMRERRRQVFEDHRVALQQQVTRQIGNACLVGLQHAHDVVLADARASSEALVSRRMEGQDLVLISSLRPRGVR